MSVFTKKRDKPMFDLNPLAQSNAWWQHVVMLLGAGILGYIIGYRRSRGIRAELEGDLASLTKDLDTCSSAVADATQELSSVSAVHTDAALYVVPAAPAVAEKPDNLKKVEGIGPKIEQLLNQAGIVTFGQLSQTGPERLTSILKAAGPRFQMHDPGTWPQQAALAAEAKWDELRVLQRELKKGKLA